jgi:hypothetical protein
MEHDLKQILQQFPRQNPDTPARTIEGEAVVITPHDSRLHSLNETGTFIWERADGSRSLVSIIEEMTAAFEVAEPQLKEDATSFVTDAVEKGLLFMDPVSKSP